MSSLNILNCQTSVFIHITAIIITQYCLSKPWGHNCVILNMSDSVTNTAGQLGYGDTENRGDGPNEMRNNLIEVNFGDDFIPTKIAFGQDHNFAISSAMKVKCWRSNCQGQLGYDDAENRGDGPNEMGKNLTEVDLGDNFDVVQISAG